MGTTTFTSYLEDEYLSAPYAGSNAQYAEGFQATFVVVDKEETTKFQASLINLEETNLKMQAYSVNQLNNTKFQASMFNVDFTTATGMQGYSEIYLNVNTCASYLETPYLEAPYLVGTICAGLGMQAISQVGQTTKFQSTAIVYNITNLRILCEFASRGLSFVPGGNNSWGNPTGTGQNWQALSGGSPITAAGDFDVSNLNTDIVEQVWRSDGTLSNVNLDFDSEVTQGITIDTLGILNHNFTTGATVVLQGANVSNFSTINTEITLTVEEDNIYYLAPEFPLSADQNRYWRFVINDPTNTDGYLEVGTIVAGSSTIFQGECFVDRVVRTQRHFSDKVRTEGFTNVSNDRALKFGIRLTFRSLKFGAGNYTRLTNIFKTARTSLKCLWIPMPRIPARFATFGKLAALPNETHNVKGDFNEDLDFVDLAIDVDESL